MSYTAFTFIIFMIVTGLLYFLMPRRARWGVLLAASYIFYFLSSKLLLFSLVATTVSVYLSGLALGRINAQFNLAKKTVPKEEKKALRQKTASRKKLVVFLAVLFNFGLLLFFKYFNFLGDTVNSIFGLFSELSPVPHLKLIMPLGISYYTLQSVSYVVDVYRGKVEPDRHFGRRTRKRERRHICRCRKYPPKNLDLRIGPVIFAEKNMIRNFNIQAWWWRSLTLVDNECGSVRV